TEARFLDIGTRLETSVETVGALTQAFGALSNELKGENLSHATRDLSQIAARVSGLADAHSGERTTFRQLSELVAAIERRVTRMGKAVKGVGMLAMNAKIA